MQQFNTKDVVNGDGKNIKPGGISLIAGICFLAIGILVMSADFFAGKDGFFHDLSRHLPESEIARFAIFGICLLVSGWLTKSDMGAFESGRDYPISWSKSRDKTKLDQDRN